MREQSIIIRKEAFYNRRGLGLASDEEAYTKLGIKKGKVLSIGRVRLWEGQVKEQVEGERKGRI